MREEYHSKLKKIFRNKLLLTRKEFKLTQEQMSEQLSISVRNFADLERGKSACSALTLVLFLIYFCPDVNQFVKELKELYESDSGEFKTNDIVC